MSTAKISPREITEIWQPEKIIHAKTFDFGIRENKSTRKLISAKINLVKVCLIAKNAAVTLLRFVTLLECTQKVYYHWIDTTVQQCTTINETSLSFRQVNPWLDVRKNVVAMTKFQRSRETSHHPILLDNCLEF